MAELETGKVNPNPEPAKTRGQARGRCHEVCGHAGSRYVESSRCGRRRRNRSLHGDRPPSPAFCLDDGHRLSDRVVSRVLSILSSPHSLRTQLSFSRSAIRPSSRSASTPNSSRNIASGWIARLTVCS